MKREPLWTKNFIGVSVSSFFLFLTFYLLMVTLPIYTMEELNGTATEIGLVVTSFLIGAVLVRPFSGIWIEKIGRRKMLAIALAIFLLSTFSYIFSSSLITFLILRFLHGIGFGIATTATGTIVADLIPDSRRGEGMGYYAMSMNIAMVVGPFLGLTLIQITDFTMMFIICTGLGLLAIISVLFVTIPSSSAQMEMKFSFKKLIDKSALPIAVVGGALAIGYSGILSFVSVYAKELDLISAATYFFVVYAIFLLASRPFTGRWFDKYGENVIIYPAILSAAAGLLLLSFSTSTFTFLVSAAFVGLGFGSLTPALQTIVIRNATPTTRGMATATFFTLFDSGIGIGSYVLGMIAASTGYGHLYLILSFFVMGCLGLYYFLHGKGQTKKIKQPQKQEAHI
ncbi:MFS transporter [Bacillus sp. FJAT-50079]|uniref:MFS transporter n=1 Tax=Bacillus sp. FJAT-50079 TaxID=2833577 RepID=UPI001BC9F1B2|nr:MFS transporter [Bacillus sp. FJAT-50079]MBS4209195.1 MFS transporter [Bacillus sp. FJAT-50079]